MPTPAQTIKEAREARGLSMNRLAAHAGCTRAAIHLWEHSQRTPRPRYAAALEKALDLPTGSILNDKSLQRRSAGGSTTTLSARLRTREDYCE